MSARTFIGIDVGTGSARAGVFDAFGKLLGSSDHPIAMWRSRPGWAQHSSADIWAAVASAVRGAVAEAGVAPEDIAALGFDATCSLVVSDRDENPVSVDPDGRPEADVIVWMDHRAAADAEAINRTGGVPLAHVGGTISPEMQIPKLRWLSREAPEAFARAAQFRDLPDWLVHRATGSGARSLCSVVCKWTYLGQHGTAGEGWDDAFLASVGLEALTGESGHARIGAEILQPGQSAGGLTERAARELGLAPGIPVAASLIDAYAGALGTLGTNGSAADGRLAVIAGTSSCHIALTSAPAFVPGVWGPYFGALLPGLWANEGGQTAAGALIDTVLARHGAWAGVVAEAEGRGVRPTALLEARLEALAGSGETAMLARSRHVQPDVHGNRSPLAEPWRRGAVDGITLETGPDDLALDYLAAVQALAYGTRQIVDAMRQAAIPITAIIPSGGLAKSELFLREMADACGCDVIVPDAPEPVLLGSAMLAAVAAGIAESPAGAMAAMAPAGRTLTPRGGAVAAYHDRKYRVFRRMQADHAAYRSIMEEGE